MQVLLSPEMGTALSRMEPWSLLGPGDAVVYCILTVGVWVGSLLNLMAHAGIGHGGSDLCVKRKRAQARDVRLSSAMACVR